MALRGIPEQVGWDGTTVGRLLRSSQSTGAGSCPADGSGAAPVREWPHHGGARCGACGGCARRGRGRTAGPSGAGGAGAALRYGSGAGSAAGQGGSSPSPSIASHHLPITFHRLLIAFPIASPSPPHRLSITSPSPPRPLPVVFLLGAARPAAVLLLGAEKVPGAAGSDLP